MRGECPELKKKLKKEKFTFKKAKAMLATWSDEDEDENSQATSGDDEVQCLMARSDDSNEGRVEELLVAEELWNDHKKSFFFPFSSAATCTNHPLEVDQRARRVSKGSNLAPTTASHRYTVNHGV
ncbi:hypothetical protein Taro_023978 [Colocasia esculenta]|uniref:Uncharacterized protein n=1 Tax=Colocasia esculenta TaxID=4460 RepID=A0A843UYY5_COLES|nr:hypothetical protein [Colocasia esculenta]